MEQFEIQIFKVMEARGRERGKKREGQRDRGRERERGKQREREQEGWRERERERERGRERGFVSRLGALPALCGPRQKSVWSKQDVKDFQTPTQPLTER